MSGDLLFGYVVGTLSIITFTIVYVIPPIIGVYSIAKIPNKCSQFNYAGFLARTGALLLDCFFTILLCSIASLMSGVIAGFISDYSQIVILSIFTFFIQMVATWLYCTLMESSKYQGTLGKIILGIRVVELDGKKISFTKANIRFFGKILSGIILNYGYYMAGWTKRKQGLHDKFASCLVVFASSPALKNDSLAKVK
jgi:uncharacterized RDD family membrane protein YckC